MAGGSIERWVQGIVRGGQAEGALARLQAGLLANALQASTIAQARIRARRLGPEVEALFEGATDLELGAVPPLRDPEELSRFYELLQGALRPAERRALGQYFTPRPLVELMWSLALDALRAQGLGLSGLRVVDPAAGSGAFLTAALQRGLEGAHLLGIEILPSAARTAIVNTSVLALQLVRAAPRVLEADAYAETTEERLVEHLQEGDAALIIGNPPYNGTSPLLKDAARLASARARLLPFADRHAPHSGFRDDFAYFFGLAHRLLERSKRPGVICLITPASVLDSRDYLGLRAFFLDHYAVQVVEVGPGAFPDARVSTAITVLTRGQGTARVHALPVERDEAIAVLTREPERATQVTELHPESPDFVLRAVATFPELEQDVDPVTDVVQRWFTPHKTGFDELLVDTDREALWERLRALGSPSFTPEGFADRFGASFATARVQTKLATARLWVKEQKSFPTQTRLEKYLRYNPRSATFAAPAEQWQHVYFEPRLATLFNHAFKGTLGRFRPHASKPQLIFNTFEEPLYAMVVEKPGVVHLYQHARFAPLHVPEACYLARGRAASDDQDRGPSTLNLTPAWQERAGWLRRPEDVLWLVAGIYASTLVQKVFAPAQGKRAAVPIKRLTRAGVPLAQRIVDRTRILAALEVRRADSSEDRQRLDLDVLRLYLGTDATEAVLRATPLGRACLT